MSKASSGPKAGREGTTQSMHRTSKSRAEKSRMTAVPVQPPVTVEIVPGRLTEEDWVSVVTGQDGEKCVLEILDSVLTRVMDQCHKVYLGRQMIPYTISQAKNAMIQIVEWTFVPRDEGENNLEMDITWQDHQEPHPSPSESWAQGCVPVSQIPPPPRSSDKQVSLESLVEITEEFTVESCPQDFTHAQVSRVPSTEDQTKKEEEETEETPKQTTTTQRSLTVFQPVPPPPQCQKIKRPYRPHRGPLRSAGLKDITKSLEETEKEMFLKQLLEIKQEKKADKNILLPPALYNILKIQLGRPPQKKDVMYDEAGNVLSVPKLDPARLPKHHVHPQVIMMGPTKESDEKGRKPLVKSGPSTSKHLKGSRRTIEKDLDLSLRAFQHIPSSSNSEKLEEWLSKPYTFSSSTLAESTRTPIPLSDGIPLDTMQLSHGVILRESNSTERGSFHSLKLREQLWREEERMLQPIQASATLPTISVDQLIRNHIPEVHPVPHLTSY
ncbi:Hypothetical predicted protein [Pelobates cultripes]|uniref:Uncharacterized protein n=2 Tax=Pelobates cultripes TaxID=61616 RepID=A0AAD1SCZ1_PELCU|nr:Hypothetical predicted protein [Pelobates cultripes]